MVLAGTRRITAVGLVARIVFVSFAHFERVANDAVFFRSPYACADQYCDEFHFQTSVISPHVRRLREKVGPALLLLPSTAVLPRDDAGRLLFVRLIDTGKWATIGGAVEPDESPHACALREAQEEARVTVELGDVLGVLGGPEYRVTYPNGDESAYVVTVFDGVVVDGTPRADGDETSEVGWFRPEELPVDQMGRLTRALLRDLGLV